MEPDGPCGEIFDGRKGDLLAPLTLYCLSFSSAIVTIVRIKRWQEKVIREVVYQCLRNEKVVDREDHGSRPK